MTSEKPTKKEKMNIKQKIKKQMLETQAFGANLSLDEALDQISGYCKERTDKIIRKFTRGY